MGARGGCKTFAGVGFFVLLQKKLASNKCNIQLFASDKNKHTQLLCMFVTVRVYGGGGYPTQAAIIALRIMRLYETTRYRVTHCTSQSSFCHTIGQGSF